ncbi:hypothetical protein HDV05_003100 [Chytridiales sp. JEL 0842]|nr:hypothetical protein HDV05_003100 [Chytridiales sp. JEL 0842]
MTEPASAVGSTQPQQQQLFELVNIGSRLVLDNVVLNGLHALRRLELRNTSDQEILIKLRSNLGSQIAFQLTNENLPDHDTQPPQQQDTRISSTPPASAATDPSLSTSPALGITGVNSSTAPSHALQTTGISESSSIESFSSANDALPPTAPTEDVNPPISPSAATTGATPPSSTTAASTTTTPFSPPTSSDPAPPPTTLVPSHQFNQLFNYVNHIDHIYLKKHERKKVIVAFLPDSRGRGKRPLNSKEYKKEVSDPGFEDSGDKSGGGGGYDRDGNDEDELYDFFEINGLIFFFAFKLNSNKGGAQGGLIQDATTNSLASGSNGNLANVVIRQPLVTSAATIPSPDSQPLAGSLGDLSQTEDFRATYLESKGDGSEPVTSSAPDCQMSLKFRARVCRSVLWTDIGETGIIFEDCVVGEIYFKDISIWNRSEIELHWLINAVDLSNRQNNSWLEFTDYDTGEPLTPTPLPAFSQRRIRVTFKPKDIGEFNYDLQLENLNDSANTVQVLIHAVVTENHREESLVVSCGNLMDFGDCISGTWHKQRMVLRNVSDGTIDVSFHPENAPIVFQLKSDDRYTPHNSNNNNSNISTNNNNRKSSSIFGDRSLENDNTSEPSREMSTFDSTISISDLSNPPSGLNSRSSSPSYYTRREHNDSSGTGGGGAPLDLMEFMRGSFSSAKSADDLIGLSNNGEEEEGGNLAEGYTRIEEISIGPGTERVIEVCYRPEKDAWTDDYRGGRWTKRAFRVVLSYGKQSAGRKKRKVVQCKARTCTSFVEVSPKLVYFGDTDVGTLKSAPIHITNCSDVAARIEMRYISKVLNCYRGEITIQPRQTFEMKIDIYPRKVNPDYCKQITAVNLCNRDNDQIIEVRSTHIDKNRVTFHSLFYRIFTPASTNFLDFGSVVLNSPVVRPFTIDNISAKKLVLEITSSMPDEIIIYCKKQTDQETTDVAKLSSLGLRKEHILESISDRRSRKRLHGAEGGPNVSIAQQLLNNNALAQFSKSRAADEGSSSTDASSGAADYLDLASVYHPDVRKSPRKKLTGPAAYSIALKELRNQFRDRGADEKLFASRVTPTSLLGKFKAVTATGGPSSLPAESPLSGGRKSPPTLLKHSETDLASPFDDPSKGRAGKVEVPDVFEKSRLPLNSLIQLLEQGTGVNPPLFSKTSAEEKYGKAQQYLRRELDACIANGRLVPVKLVDIPPKSELQLIVVMKASGAQKPNIQAKPRKHDSKIFIRLIDFDRDVKQPQFEQLLQGDHDSIPVRELMIRSSLCRSIMELGQKNINFGFLDKNEPRTKSIVIRNKSEVPLMYAIRKSGNISSGDLILGEGRIGLIRSYGQREVEFVFDPSMAGSFNERVTIENMHDRENDQVLTIKAHVRQPSKFSIKNLNLDFGACLIKENAVRSQFIEISNTSSKQMRTFEMRVDTDKLRFRGCLIELRFELEDDGQDASAATINPSDVSADGLLRRVRKPTTLLSKEAEEQLEALEQKVKIAHRKGRPDKVQKLLDKMDILRRGASLKDEKLRLTEVKDKEQEMQGQTPQSSVAENANISDPNSVKPGDAARQTKLRKKDDSIVFSLEPRAIKRILVTLRAVPTPASLLRAVTSESDNIGSQHLLADLAMVQSPDVDSLSPQMEICRGAVFVHEHKNTDVVKTISFRTSVCYDQETYINALSQDNEPVQESMVEEDANKLLDTEEGTSNDVADGLSPKLPIVLPGSMNRSIDSTLLVKPPTTSEVQPEPKSVKSTPAETSDSVVLGVAIPSEVPAEPKVVSPLKLELSVIDLGKLEINETKDCYFTLTNPNDEPVGYEVLVPSLRLEPFQFKDLRGEVGPRETLRIYLQLIPTTLGRQSHSFSVSSMSTAFTVTFEFYGIRACYLRFPTLTTDVGSKVAPELELGPCFINPSKKYAKVMPLDVENITTEPVIVTANSNLSQQCFIFVDRELDVLANDVSFEPKQTRTFYVALQPYIKASNQASSLPSSETRNLIGGLRFMVHVRESLVTKSESSAQSTSQTTSYFLLLTQTVKFSALIGMSLLSVNRSLIDLGTVKRLGEAFHGTFKISNRSGRLPLEYRLKSSSAKLALDCKENTVYTIESSATNTDDVDAVSVDISFTLMCDTWGLYEEFVEIENVNNGTQSPTVAIRLFADIGHVTAISGKLDDFERPLLRWDNVYITPSTEVPEQANSADSKALEFHIQKKNRSDVTPTYDKILELENISDELVELQPVSDLQLSIRWSLPSGGGFVLGDEATSTIAQIGQQKSNDEPETSTKWKSCGPLLLLRPKQKATATVSVPKARVKEGEQESVLFGSMLLEQGSLVLLSRGQNLALKMIEIAACFGMSEAHTEPATIQLGKIGYLNNWEDIHFSFTITNDCTIPLSYDLDTPSAFDVIEVTDDNGKVPSKRKIEGKGKSHTVHAVLRPRLIEKLQVGPRSFDISVVNAYNSANSMICRVETIITLFDLRFERLTDGELLIPPVYYPNIVGCPTSDTWFSITNSTDQETKFELSVELAPDIADFVQLEILSRFSNSPLVGVLSLGPNGSIAIRVRAYPLDDSRKLASAQNAKYLTNADGITFGTICITPKLPLIYSEVEDGGKKISERIPLRGSIAESVAFSVSEKQIAFRSTSSTDSDDEDANKQVKDLQAQRTRQIQREVIVITNLSKTRPLEFAVSVEYPLEFPAGSKIFSISPLDENGRAIVDPEGKYSLQVELLDTKVIGLSDDVKISITDVNTVSRLGHTVLVGLIEDTTGVIVENELKDSRNQNLGDTIQNLDSEGDWLPGILGSHGLEEPLSILEDEPMSATDSVPNSLPGETPVPLSARASQSEHMAKRSGNYIIHLRGCKKIQDPYSQSSLNDTGGLFELDLGQQDLGSPPVSKRIVLENASSERVSYRVKTLTELDKSWIMVGRTEGTLDPPRAAALGSGTGGGLVQRDSNTINLTFSTNSRGVYSTYISIENIDNPMDSKIIRVTIEVVAKHNIRRTQTTVANLSALPVGSVFGQDMNSNHVFDVLVNAVDFDKNSDTIEMDGLFYGTEYNARSIVIWNHESVPLEFTVKSNLKYEDPSELVFSLSRTAAKVFRSIIIEPESQARVFLRFRPALTEDEANGHHTEMTLTEASKIHEKNIEIYVNCRLVKDYQKTIYLKAFCSIPQIFLPTHDCTFHGTLKKRQDRDATGEESLPEWDLKLAPSCADLCLANILADPLSYQIVNDSAYFWVESLDISEASGTSGAAEFKGVPVPLPRNSISGTVTGNNSHVIRVHMNKAAILRDAESLRREKYIVEHMTVYNKRRPMEKYWVIFKLSFGHLTMFQTASGSKRSYNVIESQIVRLLRDINANPALCTLVAESFLPVEVMSSNGMEKAMDMFLEYSHIVEDLVHFGTREQAAENYLQLANLLFNSAIFKDMGPAALKDKDEGFMARHILAALVEQIHDLLSAVLGGQIWSDIIVDLPRVRFRPRSSTSRTWIQAGAMTVYSSTSPAVASGGARNTALAPVMPLSELRQRSRSRSRHRVRQEKEHMRSLSILEAHLNALHHKDSAPTTNTTSSKSSTGKTKSNIPGSTRIPISTNAKSAPTTANKARSKSVERIPATNAPPQSPSRPLPEVWPRHKDLLPGPPEVYPYSDDGDEYDESAPRFEVDSKASPSPMIYPSWWGHREHTPSHPYLHPKYGYLQEYPPSPPKKHSDKTLFSERYKQTTSRVASHWREAKENRRSPSPLYGRRSRSANADTYRVPARNEKPVGPSVSWENKIAQEQLYDDLDDIEDGMDVTTSVTTGWSTDEDGSGRRTSGKKKMHNVIYGDRTTPTTEIEDGTSYRDEVDSRGRSTVRTADYGTRKTSKYDGVDKGHNSFDEAIHVKSGSSSTKRHTKKKPSQNWTDPSASVDPYGVISWAFPKRMIDEATQTPFPHSSYPYSVVEKHGWAGLNSRSQKSNEIKIEEYEEEFANQAREPVPAPIAFVIPNSPPTNKSPSTNNNATPHGKNSAKKRRTPFRRPPFQHIASPSPSTGIADYKNKISPLQSRHRQKSTPKESSFEAEEKLRADVRAFWGPRKDDSSASKGDFGKTNLGVHQEFHANKNDKTVPSSTIGSRQQQSIRVLKKASSAASTVLSAGSADWAAEALKKKKYSKSGSFELKPNLKSTRNKIDEDAEEKHREERIIDIATRFLKSDVVRYALDLSVLNDSDNEDDQNNNSSKEEEEDVATAQDDKYVLADRFGRETTERRQSPSSPHEFKTHSRDSIHLDHEEPSRIIFDDPSDEIDRNGNEPPIQPESMLTDRATLFARQVTDVDMSKDEIVVGGGEDPRYSKSDLSLMERLQRLKMEFGDEV